MRNGEERPGGSFTGQMGRRCANDGQCSAIVCCAGGEGKKTTAASLFTGNCEQW